MARKVATVTIDTEGRDKGKVFVITEMSADKGERWATRVLFALMNAGVEIPEGIATAGMAGIAALGISVLTKLPFNVAEPMLAEMMDCVQYRPSPKVTRGVELDDIEEVVTRFLLKKEVFSLHFDFFTKGGE